MSDDSKKVAEVAKLMREAAEAKKLQEKVQEFEALEASTIEFNPDVQEAAKLYSDIHSSLGLYKESPTFSGIGLPPPSHANQVKDNRVDPAVAAYEQLETQISQFESGLEEDETLVVQVMSGGSTLRVETISYGAPSLIYFKGRTPDGHRMQLIQEVSQLNVVLIAASLRPGDKKAPIGFIRPD